MSVILLTITEAPAFKDNSARHYRRCSCCKLAAAALLVWLDKSDSVVTLSFHNVFVFAGHKATM